MQPYHLDAEFFSSFSPRFIYKYIFFCFSVQKKKEAVISFNFHLFGVVNFARNCHATLGKAADDVGDLLYCLCIIKHFLSSLP